ncbi:hypothetical protein FI667_g3116, partial [Globisporangium splendens]
MLVLYELPLIQYSLWTWQVEVEVATGSRHFTPLVMCSQHCALLILRRERETKDQSVPGSQVTALKITPRLDAEVSIKIDGVPLSAVAVGLAAAMASTADSE